MQSVRPWVRFFLGKGSNPLFPFVPADYLVVNLKIPTISQLDNDFLKPQHAAAFFKIFKHQEECI